jgi:dolichol-phosphate mannosyltransferase
LTNFREILIKWKTLNSLVRGVIREILAVRKEYKDSDTDISPVEGSGCAMSRHYITGKDVYVVLPTYNERENIRQLIPIILKKGPNIKVLVVDDNSPDGTGQVVAEIARASERVSLLSRSGKLGLGTAYVDGFKWVLKHSDADYVMEMDADFSHNPDRIPDFVARVDEGYDVVIGSRYLKGVSVVNWPIRRLILSYVASRYARWVTRIPLKDQTTGYKCFRRQVLETLDLDGICSDGYAFQIELNYRAMEQGFKLAEVPIIFEERQNGYSKMSRRIVWEAVWMVWHLRLASAFGRLNVLGKSRDTGTRERIRQKALGQAGTYGRSTCR